jgi:hypothetical protein
MLTENSRDESSFWIHLKLKVELMSERIESLIQQHLRLLFIFTTVLHFSLSYGIGVFHFIGFYDSIANTLLKFNVSIYIQTTFPFPTPNLNDVCFLDNTALGTSVSISMVIPRDLVYNHCHSNHLCCWEAIHHEHDFTGTFCMEPPEE